MLTATTLHAGLLPALNSAVSMYDRGTAQHSARVARMAAQMGERLGMGRRDVEAARWAGMLHDLGKLAVPPEVLRKPGPLDEDEWAEVRRHPIVGAEMLVAVSPELGAVAAAVRAHHERWDGRGYPDGAAGEAIPLLGRIVSLADVYDSLTHPRPYRTGHFTPPQAMTELERGAGTRFDPALVPMFVEAQVDELTGRR
jgi:putative nucleotidyltransferase with HDIG domain